MNYRMGLKASATLKDMIGVAQLLAANTALASSPPFPWATLTIKPSWQAQTRISITTVGLDRDTRRLDYLMVREQNGVLQQADSRNCPVMRVVIGDMKAIELMQPDPPGFSDDDLTVTADGTWYTLEGPGRFQDSHSGKFRMESNVGTPLATWARRVEEVLAPCWK